VSYEPISGDLVYRTLYGHPNIIMACNVRMTKGVARGIIKAAKDFDSVVILEIARSESDLSGGYTGMTPQDYAEEVRKAAREADWDMYVLHADHISIKKGDLDDLDGTKKLIEAQIKAGYTSYAIDASHLFNLKGGNLKEELADNIRCTTEIAKFIEERVGKSDFGLEVEVGEIGKKDATGMVRTTPDEAVTFLTSLKENGVSPNLLAIANGSAHGNTLDANGKIVPQVSIDIPQTRAVADAIKKAGLEVAIAQHGITGTPRELIAKHFPKGDILKGNVGTHWQNIFFDVVKIYDPKLYDEIRSWTIEKYKPKDPTRPDEVIFQKNCKNAFKPFLAKGRSLGSDTEQALEAWAYAEAIMYLKAFESRGTASIVRKAI
jgi:fructose-bisphosphate aldolase, class II